MGKIQYAPANMFWRGAMPKLAAAKARTGNPPRIAIVGDSNVAGQGAGTGTGITGARGLSFPVKMFSDLGWNAGGFMGNQNCQVDINNYDSRQVGGSFTAPGGTTVGYSYLRCVGASASDYVFNSDVAFDSFVFYYPKNAGFNTSVEVEVDGVSVGIVNQNSAVKEFGSSAFSCALGIHEIRIRSLSTGNAYIHGILVKDSTKNDPILIHGGWRGALMSNMNDSSDVWSNKNALISLQPDVTVLYCSINDLNSGTAETAIRDLFVSFCSSMHDANSDLVIVSPFPFNNEKVMDGTLDRHSDFIRNLATSYGGSFLDCRYAFGPSYSNALARGLAYDSLHPSVSGHQMIATALKRLLNG